MPFPPTPGNPATSCPSTSSFTASQSLTRSPSLSQCLQLGVCGWGQVFAMKILFIRHGETVDNVAHKYAGITDSALTPNGVTQTLLLGQHLVSERKLTFTHIFSSDLQRAYKTAEAILETQRKANTNASPNASSSSSNDATAIAKPNGAAPATEIKRLPILRECSFGSLEGHVIVRPFRPPPDKESRQSMVHRAETFLNYHLLSAASGKDVVAVVSHGIFLATLWAAFVRRFGTRVLVAEGCGWRVGNSVRWGNTAFVEVDVVWEGAGCRRCVVLGANVRSHLKGLGRSSGVGSAGDDGRQMKLDGFLWRGTSDG